MNVTVVYQLFVKNTQRLFNVYMEKGGIEKIFANVLTAMYGLFAIIPHQSVIFAQDQSENCVHASMPK